MVILVNTSDILHLLHERLPQILTLIENFAN